MGLIDNLQIGVKSLLAQQRAMEVVGHNIANVNTPGYSKQKSTLISSMPVLYNNLFFGTGVDLENIYQVRDRFIDYSILREKQTKEGYDSSLKLSNIVDGIFVENDENGLNKAISSFFNSFHELSTNPESLTLRNGVITEAQKMVNIFRSRSQQLNDLQKVADSEIDSYANQINTITQQIARLNEKISNSIASNSQPNDLIDKRNILVEQLGELMSINVYETDTRSMTISTKSGKSLVVGSEWFQVKSVRDPSNQNFHELYIYDNNTLRNVTDEITSGKIGGNLEMRDTLIPQYKKGLDDLAYAITTEVNSKHQAGYGLEGSTGNMFFVPPAGVISDGEAARMNVDSSVLSD
ncbi:MAG: flagellar hook-associated protein FlgK, partial [Candidatus Schekmanbacteria bacterium RBG_13_48_7]